MATFNDSEVFIFQYTILLDHYQTMADKHASRNGNIHRKPNISRPSIKYTIVDFCDDE